MSGGDDAPEWRVLRFEPAKLRDDRAQYVQLGGIIFKYNGRELSMDGVDVCNPEGHPPAGASPFCAIDRRLETKWADYRKGALEFKFPNMIKVDEYSFYTASDEPDCDPIRWALKASIDGRTWTLLHIQAQDFPTPSQRGASIGAIHIAQQWKPERGYGTGWNPASRHLNMAYQHVVNPMDPTRPVPNMLRGDDGPRPVGEDPNYSAGYAAGVSAAAAAGYGGCAGHMGGAQPGDYQPPVPPTGFPPPTMSGYAQQPMYPMGSVPCVPGSGCYPQPQYPMGTMPVGSGMMMPPGSMMQPYGTMPMGYGHGYPGHHDHRRRHRRKGVC